MSDLIDRQSVKEWLERWEGYLDKDMIARMQLKVDDIPSHQTPSNALGALDCVSREELTKRIEAYFDGLPIQVHYDMLALAQKLPSAQPERKTGKWVGKERFVNSPEFYSWQCSVCGCVLEDPTLDKPYPFCPNCGADMRGEQDD